MPKVTDKRLPVYIRVHGFRWQMKMPWSKLPVARQWRDIPGDPKADDIRRKLEGQGYRVEVVR